MIESKILFKQLAGSAPYQPATNYWRTVELDAVQRHGLPRGRALDLGCGDGKLTEILIDALGDREHRQWVGIDPDYDETELAERCGVYSRVITCPGDSVPEPDASFDLVFSNSVLEHIPDLEPIVRETSRLLERNGRFIFTVPSEQFHACLGGPFIGKKSATYLKEIDARCAHIRYFSLQEWGELLARHGLRIANHSRYLTAIQARRWENLSNLTAGLLYRLQGGTLQPIQIQRRLRMRSQRRRAVDSIASLVSRIATVRANLNAVSPSEKYACLLIEAVKD